jgi:hypothetical protein
MVEGEFMRWSYQKIIVDKIKLPKQASLVKNEASGAVCHLDE